MPIAEDLKVFTGNAHPRLSHDICSYLGIRPGQIDVFKFKNDNTFVKILENIRERDVFIVQPFSAPVNDNIMELLIMLDAAKRASARRITAVLPYYAYGRSDKKDQPRVPITARLVATMIEAAGADRVLTLDLHAGQIQGFFNIPVDELTAIPMLAHHFANGEDLVVAATDAGGAKRARDTADLIGADIAIAEKRRLGNSEKVVVDEVIGDVKGRKVIIVDEEISTGGTVVAAGRRSRLARRTGSLLRRNARRSVRRRSDSHGTEPHHRDRGDRLPADQMRKIGIQDTGHLGSVHAGRGDSTNSQRAFSGRDVRGRGADSCGYLVKLFSN